VNRAGWFYALAMLTPAALAWAVCLTSTSLTSQVGQPPTVAPPVPRPAEALPSSPVPPRPKPVLPESSPAGTYTTQHVFLLMCDGLRWQEVFSGADAKLVTKEQGVSDPAALNAAFMRETPQQRREALLPFIWSTVPKEGVAYGNRARGSVSSVTNAYRVSYPGYSETLCGFAAPYLKDNRKIQNPGVTVFERMHAQPAFAGKVAAFATWDVFPFIFNTERCGFPVFGGTGPINFGKVNDAIRLWDTAREEIPSPWKGSCHDAVMFRPALEWTKLNSPRLVFMGFGETDEFAHSGKYHDYLISANRFDGYVRELWTTLQASEQYKGKTTLILTCDHGRGREANAAAEGAGPDGKPTAAVGSWRDHNKDVPGAEETWIIILGPDTPAMGERDGGPAVTNSQIPATIAALLGTSPTRFAELEPKAASPLNEALKPGIRR
jgi:hypothetical protein